MAMSTTSLASSNRSGRLRYANAQDLPSFPSSGLKKDGAAASAAATLGWANQKSPAPWKPDSISNSASTAALLANDKMMPVNDPQRARSQAGSQAAIMAANSARRRQHNQSSPPSLSQWGNSAANIAFKANRISPQPSPTLGTTTLTRQGSMHAAKGAMAGRRPRSFSSPQASSESYPDKANAASNALSAATIAHRPSMRVMNIPFEDAGAVPYTTMNRQMYTSHPPVKPETDEKNRNDVLHASAVAMAKQMYSRQQHQKTTQHAVSRGRASSFTRHGEGASHGLAEEEPVPIVYGNLQETAYRLAQERLAKLQDEHQKNRDLQEYYGAASLQRSGKLGTIRNKLTRRRSSSDGDIMMEDQKRSRQIRKQMSLFNTKVAEVDESKRTKDREALLAAAQRNVKAQLQGMDDKIQAYAGLGGSGKQHDWEWKAQAAAQARFDASHNPNFGKVDLGGGKFMDREEVDQIAAQKVQPLLDEINKNAEREYERRAQQKADEEKLKEEAERNKARDKEIQAIHRKLKEQQKGEDKVRKAEIKQLEKSQKEQFKAAKAEQKRVLGLAKEPKQKEKVAVAPVNEKGEVTPAEEPERSTVPEAKQEPEKAEKPEKTETGGLSRVLSIKFHKGHPKHKESKGKEVAMAPAAKTTPAPAPTGAVATGEKKSLDGEKSKAEMEPPASPSSPVPTTNKVKTWIKSHFHSRSRSKSSPTEVSSPVTKEKESGKKGITSVGGGEGFIGGVALARLSAGSSGSGGDITSADKRDVGSASPVGRTLQFEDRQDSMREMALAGRTDMDKSGEGEKGESSRSAAAAAPSPVPVPVPVPNPVFATTASPEPPATTTQPEVAAPISDIVTKSVNHDGVSSPDSEREDPMKRDQRSAVERFANDWDTTITRDKRKGRAGSVSSLSSTDLSDEVDSEDENGVDRSRDSLDRFEEARSELDRPREPPRAGDFEVGLTGGVIARPARAGSPYRGSRFSENFDAV